MSTATALALALTSLPMASATESVSTRASDTTQEKVLTPVTKKQVKKAVPITASKDVKLSFSSPAIVSKPAPAPVPVPEAVPLANAIEPIVQTQELQPAPVVEQQAAPTPAPVQQAPAPVQKPKVERTSSVGAALAASALSQIGTTQDCTRMVENALGSIGINTGDIGPSNFMKYGAVVSNPQAGDLMVQGNAHVAIYVGDGMAVSGGFDYLQTVKHPASYLGGSVYVRVG